VTLEEPFWRRFREIADERAISVNALAARIDAARPTGVGLASAIRVFVLSEALDRTNPSADSSVAA
jgi:predicted DNA-binding ribbon-helix-helix protein